MLGSYVSIDIETTGLNAWQDQVVEVAAVYDDGVTDIGQLPSFQTYIRYDRLSGHPKAFAMHADMLRKWVNNPEQCKFLEPELLMEALQAWMSPLEPFMVCGRNFNAFDRKFLDAHASRHSCPAIQWPEVHDVATLYKQSGKCLPSLAKCLEQAGIPAEDAHTALGDALAVVKLVRKHRSSNAVP